MEVVAVGAGSTTAAEAVAVARLIGLGVGGITSTSQDKATLRPYDG